jgi:hypothetical protein
MVKNGIGQRHIPRPKGHDAVAMMVLRTTRSYSAIRLLQLAGYFQHSGLATRTPSAAD